MLNKNDADLVEARDILRDAHRTYTTTISTQGMALSLETAALIWSLCNTRKPTSLLDLGSGFSSYVLRRWAHQAEDLVTVGSVDDDEVWLYKAEEFCREQEVPGGNFATWDAFKETNLRFDFIVYDLGRMKTRFENIGNALNLLKPGGLVVIDDMHKFNYSNEVRRVLAERGMSAVDMKLATIDEHEGRHCWVAM